MVSVVNLMEFMPNLEDIRCLETLCQFFILIKIELFMGRSQNCATGEEEGDLGNLSKTVTVGEAKLINGYVMLREERGCDISAATLSLSLSLF